MNRSPNGGKKETAVAPMGRPGGMGRGGMVLGGGKARDFGGTMRKLIGYLRAYRVSLIVAVLFAIASTVFTVVGPKLLGLATTRLFEGVVGQLQGTGTGIDFAYIGNIIL